MCIRDSNRIVCHKLHRFLKHRNPPALEMPNKNLMTTLMREVPFTPLINKPRQEVNDGTMDTNEQMMLEELWYKMEDTYFTSKEIVIHLSLIHI